MDTEAASGMRTAAALAALCCAMAWGGPAAAQVAEGDPEAASAWREGPRPLTLTGYWENDSSPLKPNGPNDGHYTNGMGLSIAHQPQWGDALADWMPFARQFEREHGRPRTAAGLVLGQLMFTPADIRVRELIPDDRPYAGYLFGGIYWQRSDQAGSTLDHFQLEFGVVGPASQADDVQQGIHQWIKTDRPLGWDNQIGDEPTGQFYFRKKWKLDLGKAWLDDAVGLELVPQAGFALGTVFRHIEAGATLRLGWGLPDDFGPGRLLDVASATGRPTEGPQAYLFARAGGRIVEHNIFLDGNNFRDSHRVSPEPFVGELQVGAAVGYRSGLFDFELTYSQTFLSKEFRSQDNGDAFAALTLSLTWWF